MTSTAAALRTTQSAAASTTVPATRRFPSLRTAGIVAGATALVATAAVIGLTADGSGSAPSAGHAHVASVARADAAESAHGAGTTLSTGTGQALRGTGFPAVRPDATELVHGGPGSLSDAAGRPVRTAP
jgi:hypothetical protein